MAADEAASLLLATPEQLAAGGGEHFPVPVKQSCDVRIGDLVLPVDEVGRVDELSGHIQSHVAGRVTWAGKSPDAGRYFCFVVYQAQRSLFLREQISLQPLLRHLFESGYAKNSP